MFVRKSIGIKGIIGFTGGHMVWLTLWVLLVTFIYSFTGWKWLSIPWLPLSVIATAVAFYVGFKNNQAYGKLEKYRALL
jgi:putative membrane protein